MSKPFQLFTVAVLEIPKQKKDEETLLPKLVLEPTSLMASSK